MMFREKSISKFYAFTLAAVFALTLAGCGGGGGAAMDDDGDMPPVVTPEPTPQDMCEADGGRFEADGMCTSAEVVAQETCEGAGGRYEADGMCTSAEDRITEAARNSCVAAGGRFEADGMCTSASAVAQETCEGEGGRYETNGSCTSSEDVAKEMCVAGGGRSNADGSCTSAAVLAATKSAGTKAKAIGEASQTEDDGLGGAGDTTLTLAITRPRSGTEVKFTDTDEAGDDDAKFTLTADLGGGITRHDRTQDAKDDGDVDNEIVMVSTDIDAPKATAFAKVDGQELDVDLAPTMDADNNGNPADDFTALMVAATAFGQVKSDDFTASAAATLQFMPADDDTDPDTPGDQPRAAAAVDGTYNGADGTYTCNTGEGGETVR